MRKTHVCRTEEYAFAVGSFFRLVCKKNTCFLCVDGNTITFTKSVYANAYCARLHTHQHSKKRAYRPERYIYTYMLTLNGRTKQPIFAVIFIVVDQRHKIQNRICADLIFKIGAVQRTNLKAPE